MPLSVVHLAWPGLTMMMCGLQARGLSSALSAASSACDHVRDWMLGTAPGSWVSMGVIGSGAYGQPADLCYSYPVTCKDGQWTVVEVREGRGGRPHCLRSI